MILAPSAQCTRISCAIGSLVMHIALRTPTPGVSLQYPSLSIGRYAELVSVYNSTITGPSVNFPNGIGDEQVQPHWWRPSIHQYIYTVIVNACTDLLVQACTSITATATAQQNRLCAPMSDFLQVLFFSQALTSPKDSKFEHKK